MGFWSGFEGLTGHQPGAFKGFSLKDIIDKDLWERRERKFPSPRYAEEGLDAPTTAWYKGMGRPEMMGPRVGGAGVPVNPAAVPPTYQGPQTPGVARTTAAPWANIQSQMLRDPRQGPHANDFTTLQGGSPTSAFVSPAIGMLRRDPTPRVLPPTPPGTTDEFKGGRWVPTVDKTTVVENFDDPLKSNKTTTTFKEKVNSATAWQPESGAKARPFWGLQEHFDDWLRRQRGY